MTILVAGDTGLVGRAIVRKFNEGQISFLGASSKVVDFCDRNSTFEYINLVKPEIMIMAAAKVGGIVANRDKPVDFLSLNLQIQTNLLDAAHNAKVRKVVFLGSSCIYPRECNQPIREASLLTGPLEPTNSAYAIAKISGVELVKAYRRQYGHTWISLMPTNLYGPFDNFDLESSHVLPALLRRFIEAKSTGSKSVTLWGTGSPTREFLFVDDLASAILFCANNYDDALQINVGTGIETSIKDLANLIKQIIGFEGSILWDKDKPDGTPRKVLDVGLLHSMGWKHTVELEEGIRRTYEWYLESLRTA
jgi:GDP-L-fucose synthase